MTFLRGATTPTRRLATLLLAWWFALYAGVAQACVVWPAHAAPEEMHHCCPDADELASSASQQPPEHGVEHLACAKICADKPLPGSVVVAPDHVDPPNVLGPPIELFTADLTAMRTLEQVTRDWLAIRAEQRAGPPVPIAFLRLTL